MLLITAVGCGSSPHPATEPTGAGTNDVAEATPQGDVAQVGAGEEEDESTADLAEQTTAGTVVTTIGAKPWLRR